MGNPMIDHEQLVIKIRNEKSKNKQKVVVRV